MRKFVFFLIIALASSLAGYHLTHFYEWVMYSTYSDDMVNQYYTHGRKLETPPVRIDSVKNHLAQSVETSYLEKKRNCMIDSTRVIMCGDVTDDDIIYDAASALTIAEAVWIPVYGEEWVESHYPFLVKEYEDVYQVEIPDCPFPDVTIRKQDGKILTLNTHAE